MDAADAIARAKAIAAKLAGTGAVAEFSASQAPVPAPGGDVNSMLDAAFSGGATAGSSALSVSFLKVNNLLSCDWWLLHRTKHKFVSLSSPMDRLPPQQQQERPKSVASKKPSPLSSPASAPPIPPNVPEVASNAPERFLYPSIRILVIITWGCWLGQGGASRGSWWRPVGEMWRLVLGGRVVRARRVYLVCPR